ncbi:hypothetical protein F5X99DRAFT_382326 [Biscogniauxia marginata]|nr:hypothetical protein F5X99DRAFT_382326 [Biscogniauxia marginata]
MTIVNVPLVLSGRYSARPEISLRSKSHNSGTTSNNTPMIYPSPIRGGEGTGAMPSYRYHHTSTFGSWYDCSTPSAGYSVGQAHVRNVSPGTCVQPSASEARVWEFQNQYRDEPPSYNNDDETSEFLSFNEDNMTSSTVSPQSQPPTLELNQALAKERDELTESVLRQFLRRYGTSKIGDRRARSWPPSSDERHPSLAYSDAHAEAEQEHSTSDNHTAHYGKPTETSRAFACPFYRHNPAEHLNCLRYADMRRIEDLIQHLEDAHHQRPFCPICNALFNTSSSCDEHIRSRQCSPQPATWSMGITYREHQEIIDQTKTWRVPAVKWFITWSIIFPDEEPPMRPYLSGGIESEILAVQDFWAESGREIISDFMRGGNGLHGHGPLDEEHNTAALYQAVLDQMIDQLITSYKELKDDRVQECSRGA